MEMKMPKITVPLSDREIDELTTDDLTGNGHVEGARKMPKGGKLKDSRPPLKVKSKRRILKGDEDDTDE
jgi:hypothetical protein